MGQVTSGIDRICASDPSSEAVTVSTDVNTEIAESHQRQKENEHQQSEQTVNVDHDQKYNEQKHEQKYFRMKEELKAAKTEIQRVITQYNLQIYQLTSKYNKLEEQYQKELQQKASLLHDLQDALRENQSLKSQQMTKDLESDTEINEYKISITKLQQQIDAYSSKKGTNNEYEQVISNLTANIKEYEKQIAHEKDEINVFQNELNVYKTKPQEIDVNDNEKHLQKEEKLDVMKEVPLSDTQKQIEVLHDEGARVRSLYLCNKSVCVNGNDMNFSKWLETHLNERSAQTLWNELKYDRVNAKVFVSLMVSTVTINKTKLYQQRTNKKKPDIDKAKLRRFVQHLCAWIIRNKGIQTNEKVLVEMKREDGVIIKEEVFKYKLSLSQQEFQKNMSEWITQYVEDQGILDNVI